MTGNRDLENEQQLLASYMRARPGDLGPGPATARRAASDTRYRPGSLIIAWRLCISRPATIFSSGYTHLNCLYKARRTIQFSCGITTILGGYTTLDLPYHARPAMQFSTGYLQIYTGEPVSREPVSREPMPPSASVQRRNAWKNCVTYISPPTGHVKLHTNYIYMSAKLHMNYIYNPDRNM